ncbi:heavy-metal-associated domain-containing protein [Formosa sp. PL04]|uniref:heavy-metal-associated domain-containing protein n=1 Tax=Formosa sp. PL04 TaxID=3081755 RepID=UPI0029824C5C|nr:heavy-metal-associated domain-containing protein [Formosa sp. PL04]MDW5290890.1 heavy-metal-associated domain-containing protein [Formosa sp. PL04]
MNLISENIIPGNHGKIFGTDVLKDEQMERVKVRLQKIDGVKSVTLIKGVFPKEFIVYTSKLISISTIQDEVNNMGLHAIPKGLFEL